MIIYMKYLPAIIAEVLAELKVFIKGYAQDYMVFCHSSYFPQSFQVSFFRKMFDQFRADDQVKCPVRKGQIFRRGAYFIDFDIV